MRLSATLLLLSAPSLCLGLLLMSPVVTPRHAQPRLSTASASAAAASTTLAADEAWIEKLDLKAFGGDVRALGRRLAKDEGAADLDHFNKIRRWSRLCGVVGVATMALLPR